MSIKIININFSNKREAYRDKRESFNLRLCRLIVFLSDRYKMDFYHFRELRTDFSSEEQKSIQNLEITLTSKRTPSETNSSIGRIYHNKPINNEIIK